ncbi:unnamed protein product [Lasius platythorax]|uniref:Uncharacterized protein n=1 Tax=Lasius platythorax TaxID=488582 RepID=A0AAV2NL96_9HYME
MISTRIIRKKEDASRTSRKMGTKEDVQLSNVLQTQRLYSLCHLVDDVFHLMPQKTLRMHSPRKFVTVVIYLPNRFA